MCLEDTSSPQVTINMERRKAGSLGTSPLSSSLSLVRPPKPQPAMLSSFLKWACQSARVLPSLLALEQQSTYWAHSLPLADPGDHGVVSSSVGSEYFQACYACSLLHVSTLQMY